MITIFSYLLISSITNIFLIFIEKILEMVGYLGILAGAGASVTLIVKTLLNPQRLNDLQIKTAIVTGGPETIDKERLKKWLTNQTNQNFLNNYCDSLSRAVTYRTYDYRQTLKTNLMTAIGLPVLTPYITLISLTMFSTFLKASIYKSTEQAFSGAIFYAYASYFPTVCVSFICVGNILLIVYNVYVTGCNCTLYVNQRSNTEILKALEPYRTYPSGS